MGVDFYHQWVEVRRESQRANFQVAEASFGERWQGESCNKSQGCWLHRPLAVAVEVCQGEGG